MLYFDQKNFPTKNISMQREDTQVPDNRDMSMQRENTQVPENVPGHHIVTRNHIYFYTVTWVVEGLVKNLNASPTDWHVLHQAFCEVNDAFSTCETFSVTHIENNSAERLGIMIQESEEGGCTCHIFSSKNEKYDLKIVRSIKKSVAPEEQAFGLCITPGGNYG